MHLPVWEARDQVLVIACSNALTLISEPDSRDTESLFSQMPYMPWGWPATVLYRNFTFAQLLCTTKGSHLPKQKSSK